MAWAIELNGVTSHLETEPYPNQTGSIFEIRFKTNGVPMTFGILGNEFNAANAYVRINSSGFLRARGGSNVGPNTAPPNGINVFDGDWHVLRVHYFATTHQFELDGFFTPMLSGDVMFNAWRSIGSYSSSLFRMAGQIEYAKWINNGLNDRNWDATASFHGPGIPILKDISGNNKDATGIGLPTDGSAWINLGGGPTFRQNWITNYSGVIGL